MDESKISIITPSYNSSEWIEQTYLSIKSQSYSNWEWLVTDDFSCDDTVTLLKKIRAQDPRVKVFQNEKNLGAAVSRNNSLCYAEGEFVAFIDSDDLWYPMKLQTQIEFMKENNINFSFTPYELIDKNGVKLHHSVDTHNIQYVTYYDMLRKKATLGCSTVMLRTSAFDDISMPLIRTGQDYALWLRLLKSGEKAYKLDQILTQYRILPTSISRNKIKKAKRQWAIYREIEALSLTESLVCFCFYAYRAVFRK
ncbi:TPA: glycosyltransferase family 2 protein [Escherichia coli]|uniref:glycosyltransferase family 2 protein n=1 Tax=Escherichia coli TaxID=562 RepID=UPI00197FA780|nr:glycosyltransferase family 2 protein [Escherichia coli]MBN6116351.1 glycosyltransferase family 2 protein [Escherichia coli]MBN6252785.1 glycosyltransferase family 2 protein [Escherichia coli]HAW5654661.1 glycosyltransferase family 2 protein [Escherichia coli]